MLRPHTYNTILLLVVGLLWSLSCIAASANTTLQDLSLRDLEERRADIDAELKQLASHSLRGGTGSVGYRSRKYTSSDQTHWIHINLDKTYTIDQVVLAPVLWRDSKNGVRAEGFPLAFQISAGTESHSEVIATFTEEDQLMPRIAPLAVLFPATKASWVSIEVTQLSSDIGDEKYSLQLSEVLVFSGIENVALQKNTTGWNQHSTKTPRTIHFLTDGFNPYLMDAAEGDRSQTEVLRVNTRSPEPTTLTIDLHASHAINQINLHTAHAALSIPMVSQSNWGMPRHLRVTGANDPDFSDETLLFEHEQKTMVDTGPIIMRDFPVTSCRYVRITILNLNPVLSQNEDNSRFAFTEIEVLSAGKNVALQAPIVASDNIVSNDTTLERMTDGLNYYGRILNIRIWMEQLSRRHDLETERPRVIAELSERYERQKANLQLLAWAVALLSTGTLVTILIGKVLRQRAIFQTRERIAANLHDELGANLHAIGLFGDLARQEVSKAAAEEKWGKLVRYVEEVRNLTEDAGKTARYTTNMLEAKELYENLTEEMIRTADRLLTDLEHSISFTNEEQLQTLRPSRRIDLFLFYKECLTNIIRHSGATHVKTTLTADKHEIDLTVSDNGQGWVGTPSNTPPASLKRRARLLKAKLSATSTSEGGTQIKLKFKPHRWHPFK